MDLLFGRYSAPALPSASSTPSVGPQCAIADRIVREFEAQRAASAPTPAAKPVEDPLVVADRLCAQISEARAKAEAARVAAEAQAARDRLADQVCDRVEAMLGIRRTVTP